MENLTVRDRDISHKALYESTQVVLCLCTTLKQCSEFTLEFKEILATFISQLHIYAL